MALIPTHIRFALDVADHFPIKTLQHYVSGTVYPDSWWITGIDRDLTHHARFSQTDFPKEDFTYGWHVHCCCDELQNQVHKELFSGLEKLEQTERWIQLSVAKVIQDRNDLKQIDLREMLGYLDYVKNPNQEDIELVRKFNRIVQVTYRSGDVPTPEEYGKMWLAVGLEAVTTDHLVNKLKKSIADKNLVRDIESSYQQSVNLFRNSYRN